MTELPVGGGAFHDALSASANRFCRLDRHRRSRSTHVITTSRPRAMMTLHCNTLRYIRTICSGLKIKLHGTYTDTDTDTDFLADFLARILARKSACRARRCRPTAAARAARSACHEPADLSADFCPTRAFPREDVRWGCARVHVYVYCT